ncbi:MAG: hypothetical protein ACYCVD_02345 [Desulfitobacteriaceae bacterium]
MIQGAQPPNASTSGSLSQPGSMKKRKWFNSKPENNAPQEINGIKKMIPGTLPDNLSLQGTGMYLLQQLGPPLLRQFGPPLAQRIGLPLAKRLAPPLARKVGLPLLRRIGLPLARRAGMFLIKHFIH